MYILQLCITPFYKGLSAYFLFTVTLYIQALGLRGIQVAFLLTWYRASQVRDLPPPPRSGRHPPSRLPPLRRAASSLIGSGRPLQPRRHLRVVRLPPCSAPLQAAGSSRQSSSAASHLLLQSRVLGASPSQPCVGTAAADCGCELLLASVLAAGSLPAAARRAGRFEADSFPKKKKRKKEKEQRKKDDVFVVGLRFHPSLPGDL